MVEPMMKTAPSQSADIQEGRRVLALEADALIQLADNLDASFIQTIDILHSVKGRIIITGMGKSGHVAKKIAATLASTGSPAYFVHPAEASHGDLGMIHAGDAVIALSNSGETSELYPLIHFTSRYQIPLIAITKKVDSALAKAADATITLPEVGEACPIGLAPTTSTTMMIALGDAIAATLLLRKGFSPSDFSILHPGGSLGQQLKKVEQLMHCREEMPLIAETASMRDALVMMTSKSFGCVGVCNEKGYLIGVITDGDLRRHMNDDLLAKDVKNVMTANPKSISASALAAEALNIMNTSKITSLFVSDTPTTDSFIPVGIIHIHDCLRAGER